MTELKPCPFCGKQVEMDIVPGADIGNDEYYVGCGCLSNEPGCYGLESDGDTEESVADSWNSRPLEDALKERLDYKIGELSKTMRQKIRHRDRAIQAEKRIADLESELAQARAAAVQWVTYDGTPETLPGPGRWAMVILAGHLEPLAALCLLHIDLDCAMSWASSDKDWLVSRGDRWAYLPTPPEASHD